VFIKVSEFKVLIWNLSQCWHLTWMFMV